MEIEPTVVDKKSVVKVSQEGTPDNEGLMLDKLPEPTSMKETEAFETEKDYRPLNADEPEEHHLKLLDAWSIATPECLISEDDVIFEVKGGNPEDSGSPTYEANVIYIHEKVFGEKLEPDLPCTEVKEFLISYPRLNIKYEVIAAGSA